MQEVIDAKRMEAFNAKNELVEVRIEGNAAKEKVLTEKIEEGEKHINSL
jgi:hypothetical protein